MVSFDVNKELFYEKINLASRFTKSANISLFTNQGLLFQIKNEELIITASNFVSFFNTSIKIEKKEGGNTDFIIETKKLIDFVNFLPSLKINFLIDEKKVVVSGEKTKGTFPRIKASDFPSLPQLEKEQQKISLALWRKKLPLVLFASSTDDSRQALTGVNLTAIDDRLIFVATDGFRLSFLSLKKEIDLPSMIIPASFLEEVLRTIKEEEIYLGYSQEEKAVFLRSKEDLFISRLIEGEFPQYEKVIPQEKKTSFSLVKDDFFKKIKIISIFTRETSNVVILNINKKEVLIKPKTEEESETEARQEVLDFQGEEVKIAFNIRFLIDFLSRFDEEEMVVEILKPDAPVIFKGKKDKNFFHIIMPVRISE